MVVVVDDHMLKRYVDLSGPIELRRRNSSIHSGVNGWKWERGGRRGWWFMCRARGRDSLGGHEKNVAMKWM